MKELVKAGFDKYISFEQRHFKDFLYKAWEKEKNPTGEAHLFHITDWTTPTLETAWKFVKLLQKWA